MDQEDQQGRRRNKHTWTPIEDQKLVDALLDLHNTGKYNADRGFKPGHYNAVERLLSESLPNSGLKADPHIRSRMKTLKTQFSIVFDMLNCSGFGWDATKQCVTAEKEVWDEYLQAHKNAIPFRERSFPHYETLAIVFGKDRATGKGMEHPTDVIEELDREASQETVGEDFIDIDSPSQDASIGNTSDVSLKRKRKRRLSGDSNSLGEIMKETSAYIGSELVKSSQLIKDGLDEVNLYEKRQRFTEQVMKMNLTTDQCFTAIGTIGAKRNLLDLFFTIGDNLKETWVRRYSGEY